MASAPRQVRCAIYTRKSSEEGLEQEFNSLDAQREACEAYIKSQKHEGWEAVAARYDDGGYSGGTLERPALDDLLAHIKQKKIDVVVVYKIDRLTRSLFDFSKIVEVFEAGGASFVSVTQQFNTTTSMGRLTLNVLLSFAQFEREVTGERIRDKIAASKKKGMWMGGCVPLGYEVMKRELHIREDEAQIIRRIYDLYQELGSIRAVKDEIAKMGVTTRPTAKSLGSPLSRGHVYRILTNPIYMGKISHKGQLSDGQHEGIISQNIWHAVQERLMDGAARDRDQPNADVSSPLARIIFDHKDERLTPSHAVKGGRRYRYYISNCLVQDPGNPSGLRISAPEVEGAVCSIVHGLLNDPQQLSSLMSSETDSPSDVGHAIDAARTFLAGIQKQSSYAQLLHLKKAIERITIGKSEVAVSLHRGKLAAIILKRESTDAAPPADEPTTTAHTITVPMRIGRRGRETRLILQNASTPNRPVDKVLRGMIARGYAWRHQIVSGEVASAAEISKRDKVNDGYVSRLIDLGFLAPDIITAIMNGTAPVDLTANKLQSIKNLPLDWQSQRQVLGFGH